MEYIVEILEQNNEPQSSEPQNSDDLSGDEGPPRLVVDETADVDHHDPDEVQQEVQGKTYNLRNRRSRGCHTCDGVNYIAD